MEKSKMREALDMFEEEGFTVIGLSHRISEFPSEFSDSFQVSIRTLRHEEGPIIAGDIISLIERNNYRLVHFETIANVASTAGTVSFGMIPAGTS